MHGLPWKLECLRSPVLVKGAQNGLPEDPKLELPWRASCLFPLSTIEQTLNFGPLSFT